MLNDLRTAKSPICIMSFNRPDYLLRVLTSLLIQFGCDLDSRKIILWQDGAVNPHSNKRYATDGVISDCITLFREMFPHQCVMPADTNLGVALNFDRAERFVFETIGSEAAIFLEDDMELSPHYIAVIDGLIERFRDDERVGYIGAYGDHTKTLDEQRANRHRLIVLDHNWGFALYRRHWLRIRDRVLQYLDVVGGNDYVTRDARRIAALYESWGFGCPAISQDAAKTLASIAVRTIKINTYICNARYIGEHGLHMNKTVFAERGYARTEVFPELVTSFEDLDDQRYREVLRVHRGWAGLPRPGAPAVRAPARTRITPSATPDTRAYWQSRYLSGGNSGAGSYGHLARYKASFLNKFVSSNRISSVAELGCGDGAQLSRAIYPVYTGYDISSAAVALCKAKFKDDRSKTFHYLPDVKSLDPADLGLSLDVVHHLLDDDIYHDHLACLFRIAARYAIIYGNGCVKPYDAPHVRLWDFNETIRRLKPAWSLVSVERNPFYSEVGTDPDRTWSNFYVYEAPRRTYHPTSDVAASAVPVPVSGIIGADPDTLNAVFARSGHVMFVDPLDATAIEAAIRANPAMDVTVVFVGGDPDPGFRIPALSHPEGRLRRVRVRTLADALADVHRGSADLAIFTSDSIAFLRPADARALAGRTQSQVTIVVTDATARAPRGLKALVDGGYVREILPEIGPGDRPLSAPHWIGTLARKPLVFVSLTTIRSRAGRVASTIASIVAQYPPPDRIFLNLSAEPYLQDEGIPEADIPAEIRAWEYAGLLEINYTPNTGPYRKLLPTLRSQWDANCVIVTADDDTLYPAFWLDELVQEYMRHRCVIAYRCKPMLIRDGRPRPYESWGDADANDEVRPEFRNLFVFPTGKDGILYAPSFFTEAVFDPELIRLAPTADDIAFRLATMMTATPVIAVPRTLSRSGRFESFPETQSAPNSLWSVNAGGKNDESLTRLLDHFDATGVFSIRRFLR